jgi:hypothetical protein
VFVFVCVCVCGGVCVCVCVQTVAGALGSMGPVLALVAFVVLLFGVGGIYIFGKGHVASMLHSAPHPHFHTSQTQVMQKTKAHLLDLTDRRY